MVENVKDATSEQKKYAHVIELCIPQTLAFIKVR